MTDLVQAKAEDVLSAIGAIQCLRILNDEPRLTKQDLERLTGLKADFLAGAATVRGTVSLKAENVIAIQTAFAGVTEGLIWAEAAPDVLNSALATEAIVNRGFMPVAETKPAGPAPSAARFVRTQPERGVVIDMRTGQRLTGA
ncbi:MAG: hypothetical protein EBQ96_09875 [Proteobacteria bacterium]|nr:hypothetical protein [Pseudomonadota bacterium]